MISPVLRASSYSIYFHVTAPLRSNSFTQGDGRHSVWFTRAAPRTFSLVTGADGLHSAVRRLVWGEHDRFIEDLGLRVSIFSMPDSFGLDHAGLLCSVPGRTAGVFSAGDKKAIAQR